MFAVEIHEAAFVELEALRRYERNRILDEIEEQLTQGPNTVTGRKKISFTRASTVRPEVSPPRCNATST